MASVNKVIILGNLGRDPETRYTADGAAVTNFSVATTSRWKNKAGEQQEETEWHRCTAFGRLGEIAGEYLSKGKPVYLEGRLKTRKWTDKDGHERYTTEIMVDAIQLLGGRDERDERDERTERPSRPAGKPSKPAQQDFDDDIPF